MPRRQSAPAATPKSHKRTSTSSAVATPAGGSTPGSRASKRLKEWASSTPNTTQKSKYFDGSDSDEEANGEDEEASDFNDADDASSVASPSPSATASEDEDDYESDAEAKKKKGGRKPAGRKGDSKGIGRGSGRGGGGVVVAGGVGAGKELWRAGIRTGLGPGKQVFIERPKARGDGGIPYVAGRIHPNTMMFLADLKENNDREWLKSESCAVMFGWGMGWHA
jgi:hypothetical protein